MKKTIYVISILLVTIGGCNFFENENEIPPRVEINPSPAIQGEEISVTISREDQFYISLCGSLSYQIEVNISDVWEVYKRVNAICTLDRFPFGRVNNSITDTLTINDIGNYRFVTGYKNELQGEGYHIKSKPFSVVTKN